MELGYFKVNRKLISSDLWLTETFTRGQAWIDLIALANHKDGFIRIRGINVPIKRGQIGWSEVALSKRWGWSRGKFRRFIVELKTGQMIERETVLQNIHLSSFISILNYNEYQTIGTTNSTTNGTTNGTQTINEKNVNNISVVFEVFRKAFPGNKRGLQTELDNFLKKNRSETVHLLLPALEKEKQHRETLSGQKKFVPEWKNLSTWINQKCWEQEFTESESDKINTKLKIPQKW
jgi:hypothetical protein